MALGPENRAERFVGPRLELAEARLSLAVEAVEGALDASGRSSDSPEPRIDDAEGLCAGVSIGGDRPVSSECRPQRITPRKIW